MAITKGHGNPNWTRDETILALDMYFQLEGIIPSGHDSRLIALSNLLRSLPYHLNTSKQESFRNPDGVAFKLQNLRQIDTGKGLGNVSKMDREVFAELGNERIKTRNIAELIRTSLNDIQITKSHDYDDENEFIEGRLLTRLHKIRERNPHLRNKLIRKMKDRGKLQCELCGFSPELFNDLYFESVFEAHHIIPISETSGKKTQLNDLLLLCANCHRALHKAISKERKWLSIVEAKQILFKRANRNKHNC